MKEDRKQKVEKYANQWDKHSLQKAIKQLLPNPKQEDINKRGKIIFTSDNSNVQVVYDLFGNYFRVQKIGSKNSRGSYVNIEGKECQNKVNNNGKQVGKSDEEFNRDTHYGNIDNMKRWRM